MPRSRIEIQFLSTTTGEDVALTEHEIEAIDDYRNISNEDVTTIKSLISEEYKKLSKEITDYSTERDRILSNRNLFKLFKKNLSEEEKERVNYLDKELEECWNARRIIDTALEKIQESEDGRTASNEKLKERPITAEEYIPIHGKTYTLDEYCDSENGLSTIKMTICGVIEPDYREAAYSVLIYDDKDYSEFKYMKKAELWEEIKDIEIRSPEQIEILDIIDVIKMVDDHYKKQEKQKLDEKTEIENENDIPSLADEMKDIKNELNNKKQEQSADQKTTETKRSITENVI